MIIHSFLQGLLIVLCINKNYGLEKKYNNYTLFRGIPESDIHLSFFKNLSSWYGADYWRSPGEHLNRPVEFLIKPDVKKDFIKHAEQYDIYLKTIMEDVQREFDLQTVKSYIRRNVGSFNWQSYYRLKDIYDWLDDLSKINPKVMQLESIGRSIKGNDIMAVRIVLKGSTMRSKVIIEGGIHSREWISPAFVTYMIHQILHAPESENKLLRSIALTYEWLFVPVLNPDGYEITFDKDRLWRKNNNGVDLNRNFEVAFGTIGVSFNPHDETYCGKKAFSEPESQAMASFVSKNRDRLEYYLSFHSYGQYMILPYTYSKKHSGNYNQVKLMCDEAAKTIYRRYKTRYSIGTAYDTVGYMTSGVSGCWAKKTFDVPYVVTMELRDSGRHGFALPPDKILPTCEETLDGMMSLLIPRSKTFKLRDTREKGGQEKVFLDVFVLVWNVILFIIVRF